MLGLGNLLTSSSSIQNAVQKQAAAFRTRVIDDSGNFEAKACLEAQLTTLSNIE